MEKVISAVFWSFTLLFVAYIGLSVTPSDILPTPDRERLISENLGVIAGELWEFAKPLLQLAFIVLIIEFAFSKFSGKQLPSSIGSIADVKSLIAIIVILTFSVSALAGTGTSDLLKDVALVVIGFYFGGGTSVKTEIVTQSDNTPHSPPTITNTIPTQPKGRGESSEEIKAKAKASFHDKYEQGPEVNAVASATQNHSRPYDETIEARQVEAKNKLDELKKQLGEES